MKNGPLREKDFTVSAALQNARHIMLGLKELRITIVFYVKFLF